MVSPRGGLRHILIPVSAFDSVSYQCTVAILSPPSVGLLLVVSITRGERGGGESEHEGSDLISLS